MPAIMHLIYPFLDHFYYTYLSLTMTSEKARFEQEVAQVEQWWKVIYYLAT